MRMRRRYEMGLLKRKEERSETISLRIPASVKTELEELRREADAAGFDLTATITETLIRFAKQIRVELKGRVGRTVETTLVPKVNGAAATGPVVGRAS
jgi:hypothetical protein